MGKIIDSAIIGVITFVAMAILRLDFALLISVFIGITNIIPVFGPFIGAIPSIFILLLVDPIQAVIFGVLILVIQQVDGNFIGPKILGSSIGISALWILFSIVVGGDLFGLVGMVVGVPLFATFYGLAREFVHYMLDKRGLDSEGNHVGEVVEDEENVMQGGNGRCNARPAKPLCPFFIKKGPKKFQRLTPKAKHLFTAFYRSKQVLIFYGFVCG